MIQLQWYHDMICGYSRVMRVRVMKWNEVKWIDGIDDDYLRITCWYLVEGRVD